MPAEVLVRNLVKSYDDVRAVEGVSFEVEKGEIFGLLGRNGAGKTTTLECILGLRVPDAGEINIAGIDALRERDRVKEQIGAVLQSTGLPESITPREALGLFASFYRKSIGVDQLLIRFSLQEKSDVAVDTLSGGQRQRLALALAFVNDPLVVFLDEPTSGLDAHARRELHEMIREEKRSGRTLILSTHYIEEAHLLCDRIAVIDRGKVLALGTPEALIEMSKSDTRVIFQAAKPIDPSNLRTLPAAVDCLEEGGRWEITTTDATATLSGLMKHVESSGNALQDLQIHRPLLEDAFLTLTGMNIGD